MRSALSSAGDGRTAASRTPARANPRESFEIIPIYLGRARTFCQPQAAKSKPLRGLAGGPEGGRVRVRLPGMSRTDLASLDEMTARLERALAASPADATEIVWIEARRTQVTAGRGRRDAARAAGPGGRAPCERNLLVRVRQSGRTGLHRTGGVEPSDLENAVRDAVAQARLAPPTPGEPLAGGPAAAAGPGGTGPGRGDTIYDPELGELDAVRARALLDGAAERGELLRLAWVEGRVAVVNSAGLRQAARVTAASFEASCGRGPGAGRAAGAARRLDTLYLQDTLDRARGRHAVDALASDAPDAPEAPEAPEAAAGPAHLPTVLSEQGAAALVALLNRHALSAAAQRDP